MFKVYDTINVKLKIKLFFPIKDKKRSFYVLISRGRQNIISEGLMKT